ncbi:hypothetical protein F5877DRAFT_72481 [Lentinula edodes]|nr:hypothetical protein F5877DRAFT_72481 [Lentinula edodes]
MALGTRVNGRGIASGSGRNASIIIGVRRRGCRGRLGRGGELERVLGQERSLCFGLDVGIRGVRETEEARSDRTSRGGGVGREGRSDRTGTGAAEARREMGRAAEERETETGRESEREETGLRLGTGIKERRDLFARVFEYPPLRDTRDRRGMGDVPGTSREEEVDSLLLPDTDTDGDGEGEGEVIHIHQIPREGIAYPHPPSPIPPTTQKHVPLISPLLDGNEHERDGIVGQEEEEDINPSTSSPYPSSAPSAPSAPYPAPSASSSAPSAPPLAPPLLLNVPQGRVPLPRSPALSSLSLLSSSGEREEGGGFWEWVVRIEM